jgi:predicted RNase H-like HicB family nuclease
MKPIIKFEVKLPVKVFKGETAFVAHCPIIDVASQGDTVEEAKKNAVEAISLFLITCFEQGTLADVLSDCGFTLVDKEPDSFLGPDEEIINIPLPFMIPDHHANLCRA